MEEYNGYESTFGTHTIRVHLQDGKYKGYFDRRVGGNCKGIDLLTFDFESDEIDDIKCHNCAIKYYDEYDGYRVKIYNGDDHTDWSIVELESNEMGCIIVGIEIIDFVEE